MWVITVLKEHTFTVGQPVSDRLGQRFSVLYIHSDVFSLAIEAHSHTAKAVLYSWYDICLSRYSTVTIQLQ